MRVVMVGTGYVGLVSGVCFADYGHSVICVDKDPKKIVDLMNIYPTYDMKELGYEYYSVGHPE
jgi:UDPglucose 6-dehydrogenase